MSRPRPLPPLDFDEARRIGKFARGSQLSETTRSVIGLTDTVEAALNGLLGAKISATGDAHACEVSIAYLVAYLRHHEFSKAELIDVVWETAAILDRRSEAPGGPERVL